MIGVRLAEVEALYAAALSATTQAEERARLAELARAAARLAMSAAPSTRERSKIMETCRVPARKTRLRRRIAHAQHAADWIVGHSRPPGA
ncbi:hypothetical protein ACTIVE_0242 [Actinomadura verrucosospora]|uniref:Uncharacterized protein n=1 Tax=Actinomadura verrucosospora TaxID=46165 RepID=A0A7D4AGF6_ACTVE|nr:hypothetical protein ACTIVE_0242 [Actinomadura verrucosospora]